MLKWAHMDEVSQIREKIDLVAFISEYIPVKKAGRNFRAVCPFHNEKTPSFMISPDRQIWHCFGCSKGGDAYSFLMEYERMEFPEALRVLAKRTGVVLSERKGDFSGTSQKEKIYQINGLVKEFYHYILTKHQAGKKALDYVLNRGITPKMIETFGLGFSPVDGQSLVKYLMDKKHYSRDELFEAGLVFQGRGGIFDFFRGRLIFPLVDHRDNVIGFSGRVLDPNEKISKYINTRDTLAYHKGEVFYGMNVTRDAIRREERAIIVEGEFDVISCFQNGISNVVGVKGTALTESQVGLLARFAKKITFCFDGDNAGQDAIRRSLLVVEKKGLTPSVIEIPTGKDPDEALQKDAGAFKKAVSEDRGIYDYLLEKAALAYDPHSSEGKKEISDLMLPLITNIQNEIVKEHYLKKLSQNLDTTYESILKQAERLLKKEKVEVPRTESKTIRPKDEVLEELILSLILQAEEPKLLLEKVSAILSDCPSQERASFKILEKLGPYLAKIEKFDSQKFSHLLPDELLSAYDKCLLMPVPAFDEEKKVLSEIEKSAKALRLLLIHQKMKDVALKIESSPDQDGEEALSLKKEYSSLATLLDSD